MSARAARLLLPVIYLGFISLGLPDGTLGVAWPRMHESLGLPIGPAEGFWTEASLFSAAGLAALVYGPGDIAQAHGADEWVALPQLEQVAHQYQRMISERRC